MDLNLANALGQVKVLLEDTSEKSNRRRLSMLKEPVSCYAGCSACCNRQIHITIAEAIVILDHLQKQNRWEEVRNRAIKTAKLCHETPPVSWFKMNISCPILDPMERKCLAYSVRPSTCSTHFVVSNPSLCDPWATQAGGYKAVIIKDVLVEFTKKLGEVIDGHGMLALRMSIPLALLLAEKMKVQMNISYENMISLIFNELA